MNTQTFTSLALQLIFDISSGHFFWHSRPKWSIFSKVTTTCSYTSEKRCTPSKQRRGRKGVHSFIITYYLRTSYPKSGDKSYFGFYIDRAKSNMNSNWDKKITSLQILKSWLSARYLNIDIKWSFHKQDQCFENLLKQELHSSNR